VIDNSSAFRKDPDVPLIVPEVNPDAVKLTTHKKNIIANPNCSTAQLVVALKPLHDAAKIKRAVVSTYQSVSGAGKEGMDELWNQTKAIYGLGDAKPKKFPKQIAFNVIPFIGSFNEDGYTDEEAEDVGRDPQDAGPEHQADGHLRPRAGLRGPLGIGHGRVRSSDLGRRGRAILREAPGVLVVDKHEHDGYITPVDAAGEHAVYVSRIRKDHTVENGLVFWVVSDNLRKGAALNAVQIAQLLDETGTIKPSTGYRSITV
jgi:aspartate-semialdehyde dehydrogenase